MSSSNELIYNRISLERPAYNDISLKKIYNYNDQVRQEDDEIVHKIAKKSKNYIEKNLKLSKNCFLSFLYNLFPILKWIPKYEIKYDTVKDLLAGLTVGNYRYYLLSFVKN